MNHYVYILRCADDTLYTGWTNDIVKTIPAKALNTPGRDCRRSWYTQKNSMIRSKRRRGSMLSSNSPEQSNERIANFLRIVHICEARGSGFDRIEEGMREA